MDGFFNFTIFVLFLKFVVKFTANFFPDITWYVRQISANYEKKVILFVFNFITIRTSSKTPQMMSRS